MSHTTREAEASDLARIATLMRLAFDGGLFSLMYPTSNAQEVEELQEYYYQKTVIRSQEPSITYRVAFKSGVDQACASACWQFPVPGPVVPRSQADEAEKIATPKFINKPLVDAFSNSLDECRKNHVDVDKDIILRTLETDPEYQRQGFGKQLLQWGLDKADEQGTRVYLESSTAGFELYRKAGFEVIGDFELNTVPYGGTEKYKWLLMRREPVKKAA